MAGLLVIMGSGETTPTMIKPHRSIFERVGDRAAVLLDTPYGFQSNADDISARAVSYFDASVGRRVGVASWRTALPPGLARERTLAAIAQAGWVFSGPGSPTYALRQWRDTPITTALSEVLARDGVVLLASAAAVTMGSHAVPVYEIYKAGFEPYWEPGLDLVSRVCGLPAVVIPHYDNTEGGTHDTRYCYLGETRLAALERELPESSLVLGVDEHTAVLLDPEARTASVVGNGGLTIRRQGSSVVYPAGSVVGFDAILGTAGPAVPGESAYSVAPSHPVAAPQRSAASLRAVADDLTARFDAALADRDVDRCVEAILALDRARLDWAADTNVSDDAEHAASALRAMVVRLGELATVGARDPRETVGPFVEALLTMRARARAAKDFAASDEIRDCLVEAGIEVRDTAAGVEWTLR
jgi:cyanophycinase-like exopeptidase